MDPSFDHNRLYMRLSGLEVRVVGLSVLQIYEMCVFTYYVMLDIGINILCDKKIGILFRIAEMDFEEETLL